VEQARFALETDSEGRRWLRLSGEWTLRALAERQPALALELARLARLPALAWDLRGIAALDSAGATILWHAWGRRRIASLALRPDQGPILDRVEAACVNDAAKPSLPSRLEWLVAIGRPVLHFFSHLADLIALIGQLVLDAAHLARHPRDIPWRETSANLFKSGVRAMPVTALVGFLIGVVLSYLSALQLKTFGAGIFIINILGIGIIRELGPVLVAVLVAGRSGSAMTAQLGVMRVTEEIDALATMGVSRSLRLVLPKVAALAVVMPLLVLWTSATAILGGMAAAQWQLDIGYGFFIDTLPKVVPVANLWIALAKGVTFGVLVALVACHFGLRVRPNTESLSSNTTASVVAGITIVMLVDAVFAVATRNIGIQ